MRFIGTEISVDLPDAFVLEKKPPVPLAFIWEGARHRVAEMLAEWHRYGTPDVRTQGGRPPYHVRSGRTQGSWGQGRVYYRVRTVEGNDFYEMACNKCGAKLAYGQHKTGGGLFPKRKKEDGSYDREHRGWYKWQGSQ